MENSLFLEALETESLADPALHQYYHNLFDRRTIVLNQEIDENIIEMVSLPLLEWDNDNSGKPITILLNSPGGSVLPALHLCNIIEQLKTPTTIIVLGYALSMGFILACSGSKNPNVITKAYEGSIFMYQEGDINLGGTSGQAKSFMKFNEKLEKYMEDFIISHTEITQKDYEAYRDQDQWLTAQEALQLGVIDEIIGKVNEPNE